MPMILEVDNKAAVDLCNNWSIGGRTRHVEVKQFFLRELKERGIVHVKWTSGEKMTSDIFTKNLAGPLFDKHAQSLVGRDGYMAAHGDIEWTESMSIPKGRVSEYSGSSARFNAYLGCNVRDRNTGDVFGIKSRDKTNPIDRSSRAGQTANDPRHKILSKGEDVQKRDKDRVAEKAKFMEKNRGRRNKVEKNQKVDMTSKWEPCMFGTDGFEKTVIDMDYCRVWAPILE